MITLAAYPALLGGLAGDVEAPGDVGPAVAVLVAQVADRVPDGGIGHLYPGEMDRYADGLNGAADEAGEAQMRPDDEDDDPPTEESGL